MELSNFKCETPVRIEAPHDGKKTTIFRAVLFAITGKDVDGKEFDGRIYQKNSTMLSDLAVEVEIEQGGVIFNKQAKGSEKRQKGSDETELQRSVTSVYSIDYKVVNKSEYDAKILEVFGNFHLFCNPDYFRNLKKEDKRSIFSSLVQVDKNNYFNGLSDKKTVSGRIKDQNDQIFAKNSQLEELKKVQEPEKIEIVDYDSQLMALRQQQRDATPTLSFLQVETNNEINKQIARIDQSVFVPTPTTPLLPEPENPILVDIEALKKELEKVKFSEPDTHFIDTQIERVKLKISNIKALSLQLDNYDENVSNAKCTLCQVCAAPDCQFKQVEVLSKEELYVEIGKLMPLSIAETSLANLEDDRIDYLRTFEHNKESEILRLECEIIESEAHNNGLLIEYGKQKSDVIAKNSEATAKNAEIQIKNSNGIANFDTEKAQKIADLKKQLHVLPDFDYSEIDEKIGNLLIEDNEQQTMINAYNKALGSFEYARQRIGELSDELHKLKQALYSSERELIKIKDAENRYYSDFESLINNEMPENIRVSLFKKNLSNDEYSECFEIEFNGSIYAGNGKTIAFYIWLCNWFQNKLGKDLPIFIDEAIILNESLYCDMKNTVILMRNDECKTLKITKL